MQPTVDEPTFVPAQVTGEEPAHVPVRVGDVLEDKWRLERKLGEGGMGTVFLAHDLLLERKVAIKLLGVALANDPELVMRFEREARLTAGLEHPNIVPVYAVGRFRQVRPFMVMKALDGVTLHTLVKSKGPLHARDLLHLARQMAAGLDFIHSRGFIHRDIKAANIFVGPDGHATILDFGILRASRGAENITRTGLVMGTPHYMSPEQAKGIRDLDARSDLYAFAVLLFECAAGSLPFESDNDLSVIQMQAHSQAPDICARAPWVPRAVGDVLARALSKDPQARYPSAGDLYRAIEAAYSGQTPMPLEVPAVRTPPPPMSAAQAPISLPIQIIPEGFRPTMAGPNGAPSVSGPVLLGTPLLSGSNPSLPAMSVPPSSEPVLLGTPIHSGSNPSLQAMQGMPLGMEPQQRASNPSLQAMPGMSGGMPLGMEPQQRASNPSLQAMPGGMPLGMEPQQRASNPSLRAMPGGMPLGMEPQQRASNASLPPMGGGMAFPPTMPLPAAGAAPMGPLVSQPSAQLNTPPPEPLFSPGMSVPVPAVAGHGSPMFSGPVAVAPPMYSGPVQVPGPVVGSAALLTPQDPILRMPDARPVAVPAPPLTPLPELKRSRGPLIGAIAGVAVLAVVVGLVLALRSPKPVEPPKVPDTPVTTNRTTPPADPSGTPPNAVTPVDPASVAGQTSGQTSGQASGQTGAVANGQTEPSGQNPEDPGPGRTPTEDPSLAPVPIVDRDNTSSAQSPKKPPKDPEQARLTALGKGQLRVISTRNNEPYWAKVLVDGEDKGSTPLSLELSSGMHKVRLERDGFKPVERQIKIAPTRPAVLRIELVP